MKRLIGNGYQNVFDETYNLGVTIGIKCNAAPILGRLKKRYISSPFDNMDSVKGFAEAGVLIGNKFHGYFDNVSKWKVCDRRDPKSQNIKAKVLWNEEIPNLFYPHFHPGWFPDISEDAIKSWVLEPNGSLDLVWEGFKNTYYRRKKRLDNILSSAENVLFIRIEARDQIRHLKKIDLIESAKTFNKSVEKAYPDLNFRTLYFYCESDERVDEMLRLKDCDIGRTQIEFIPSNVNEADYSQRVLESLKLLPRSRLGAE